MDFDTCLGILSTIEGGWTIDSGGPTYRGVTQETYDVWRRRHALPGRPVREMTDAEMRAIYYENYWLPLHCGALPDGWAVFLFVQAVNLPWGDAVLIMQGALMYEGAYTGAIDGAIGPMTIGAARSKPAAVFTAIQACIGHYAINSPPNEQRGLIVGRLGKLKAAIERLGSAGAIDGS
jgi:lysozyme family protein